MSYKTRHEDFVSNLAGGTIGEIYQISSVLILSYVVWWCLSRHVSAGFSAHALDFLLNWAVCLVAVTIYASRIWYLAALIALPVIFTGFPRGGPVAQPNAKNAPSGTPRKPFLTVYRGSMIILTVIAILAVDFRIFPRRFAKVETWGTSLMDLGVGSFVFSMGLVSAKPVLQEALDSSKYKSFVAQMRSALCHSAKLLVLGFARLVSVKFLGYQEHETEYGTHWNFFMTLGMLPPFVALFQRMAFRIPLLVVGLAVAFGYEIALKNTGLQEWILAAPRLNFVSQNKEGISSFVGYLAIFLIGQSAGLYVLPQTLGEKTSFLYPPTRQQLLKPVKSTTYKIVTRLFATSVFFHALFFILRTETQVSRRLANLPYITWVCGYNTGTLAIFALASHIMNAEASPSHSTVNSHGQTMFLLGNLLTGLVNLTFKTIDMTPLNSILVLLAYALVLYLASFMIHRIL